MRICPLLPLLFLVVTSCSNSEPASPQAFAEKFTAAESKAWLTGDLSDLKAVEDTDVVFHLGSVDLKGWSAHEDYIVKGRPTVSNLKQDWKYLSGEGNHFVLDYSASGTLLGDNKTPPADFTNSYLFAVRIRDNKVAEVWANGSSTTSELTKKSKKK